MPPKTHHSIPLALHPPETWKPQPDNDSRNSRMNFNPIEVYHTMAGRIAFVLALVATGAMVFPVVAGLVGCHYR
jgi:hypothetical protein